MKLSPKIILKPATVIVSHAPAAKSQDIALLYLSLTFLPARHLPLLIFF